MFFADYFFPGTRAGGPLTSLSNLYKTLQSEFDVTIVTRNRDISSAEIYKDVLSDQLTQFGPYSTVYLSRVNLGSTMKTIAHIDPDIIYLNSFYSVFTRVVLALCCSGKLKAKIILAPRGEFQVNAVAMKRYRKLLYIAFFRALRLAKRITFHATDQIEADRIRCFFGDAQVLVLPNIPRPISVPPREKKQFELKLVFVGRIRSNKNLHYAIDVLSKVDADVSLDIYGPVEDDRYWNECNAQIKKLKRNVRVRYVGLMAHEDVPSILLGYHALFLPTETENFGHAIVEAMQSGVVPIISDQTPWRHLGEQNAGWDISLGRPDLFVDAIHQLYRMDSFDYSELSTSTIKYILGKLKVEQLKLEYSRTFSD